MRNPHRSVGRLPAARRYGGLVRSLLIRAVELWPKLTGPAFNILNGKEAEPLDTSTGRSREEVDPRSFVRIYRAATPHCKGHDPASG